MGTIRDRVEAVRSRQQRQWLWQALSIGLVIGGLLGSFLGIVRLLSPETLSLVWIAAAILACPLVGIGYAILVPRCSREAAIAIDRRYRLKDRIATAYNFMNHTIASPIQHLQVSDAETHVTAVDPAQVAPYRAPRAWGWGLMFSVAAFVLAVVSSPRTELNAAVVQNRVVVDQAVRVTAELEELEKFNQQNEDPEIDKLLKELAEKIEELKQPGIDPKEALAKLSEMEAMLQAKQEQLADPSTEAALQQIGEALSLAEPFQAAGEAMAQGDMEKAAEELAKLELPKLDRQTERSLTEKLEQAKQNASQGSQRQLREATNQTAAGITQGDRSKFKEGMEGLASECKKQGNRKKLSDLLRKQCNCLAECKSECEGECKNTGQNKGKGGKNWGLASSGNEPGEKTAKLKTGPQMQITGAESESGDVDVETMTSPEQEQEAIRQYREKIEKYEQISESVLETEPIPLGHRQTIRRYFEMIRPQADETDAVLKKSGND